MKTPMWDCHAGKRGTWVGLSFFFFVMLYFGDEEKATEGNKMGLKRSRL